MLRAPPGAQSIRLPMPHTSGAGPSPTGAWVVDPDWFGAVVVETEGTKVEEGWKDVSEEVLELVEKIWVAEDC